MPLQLCMAADMGRHFKNVMRLVVQLAMEDPSNVRRLITELEDTGEIEKGDLNYLLRLAEKWEEVAQSNRR